MPFAASSMDQETIILSEVNQRQISYNIIYMWNLKRNATNELMYKIETDPQTSRINLWLLGERMEGGTVRSLG